MENELLELLYNQKDVCQTFAEQGIEAALQLVKYKGEQIALLSDNQNPIYFRALLSSLNKGLYHYVLFQLDLSPGECCHNNFQYVHAELSRDSFMDTAKQILLTYEDYLHPVSFRNKHIEEACRFISEHLDEELTLERVSSSIYVSRCYLCQLFRSCKKTTFSEYVTNERMSRAKLLLGDDSLSIDLIAERCGYSSSSYFSTVFRKKVGLSPTQYRKQNAASA